MHEFIYNALGLAPHWSITNLAIDYAQKKIRIELDWIRGAHPIEIEVDQSQTIRYLPVFEYHTFVTAPLIWQIKNGKRTKRIPYPWEKNVPKDINQSNIL